MNKSTEIRKLKKISNLLVELQSTIGTPIIPSEVSLSNDLKNQINNEETSALVQDVMNVHIAFLSDILYETLLTLRKIATICDFKCKCDDCNDEEKN